MRFIIYSVLALGTLYGVERLFFRKKFGVFAAFFWIFALQTIILFAVEFALRKHWVPTNFAPLNDFAQAVTTLAYLSLGLTPMVAIIFAVIGALIIGLKSVRSSRQS